MHVRIQIAKLLSTFLTSLVKNSLVKNFLL